MSSYWTSRGRLSRRRFVAGASVAGGGAAALSLVGCGDDDDDDDGGDPGTASPGATTGSGSATASATAESEIKRGGTVTLGVVASNQPLDPHTSVSRATTVWPKFTNRLIDSDPEVIEPLSGALIASWEQVDDVTLVLHAEPTAKWHEGKLTNGRAWNAEDIKFNLERVLGKYDQDRIAQFQRASYLLGLDSVEVVDEMTARAVFSRPNGGFLYSCADWRMSPCAPETVEADPDFVDPTNFSGTGAFIVESYDLSTAAARYTANPNYWRTGRPYVDEIRDVDLPDQAGTLAAFLSGQTDMMEGNNPQTRSAVMDSLPDAQIVTYVSPLWDYWRLNQTRGQLTDQRVLTAMYLAHDYKGLMDHRYGEDFWVYSSQVPSEFPGTPRADKVGMRSPFNPDTKEADIAEARALLEEAGYPDGAGISFSIFGTGTNDQGVFIQGHLSQIFPDIDITVAVGTAGADFQRGLVNGDFDSVVYTSGPPPDINLDLYSHFHSAGSRNYTKFANADVDAKIDELIAEFDLEEKTAMYGELEQLLEQNVFNVPTGHGKSVQIRQANIRGLPIGGTGTFTGGLDTAYFLDQVWRDE